MPALIFGGADASIRRYRRAIYARAYLMQAARRIHRQQMEASAARFLMLDGSSARMPLCLADAAFIC